MNLHPLEHFDSVFGPIYLFITYDPRSRNLNATFPFEYRALFPTIMVE